MNVWLFGYGSLIWRPEIAYVERRPARLHGWARRFWQGSHDHRGMPRQPGRVVTLIEEEGGHCDGMAYLVDRGDVEAIFAALDHREKNGYRRFDVELHFSRYNPAPATTGVVYIAPPGNHAFLGPAPLAEMARQISECAGPSGRNVDYLLELAEALRQLDAQDAHVFELEAAVRHVSGSR
jgi:cation transport regulator ChaC